MSKIDEIRKRHEEVEGDIEHFRSVPTKGLGDGMKPDMRGVEAHQDRAMLLAALDGEWQSERPESGDWWLSLNPEKRIGLFDDKRPLRVVIDTTGDVIEEPSRTRLFTSQLTGALWQRRTVPRDPFTKEANHE